MAFPFTWTFTTASASQPSLSLTAVACSTRGGAAQIVVNLSGAATVTVSIANVAGRTVAVLPPQELPQGVSTLLWDGKSAAGTRAPAGRYLAAVRARSADGATARCLVPLQR